jgi:hypothetical protein
MWWSAVVKSEWELRWHVSSGTPLIIRSSNCLCSFWFTYAGYISMWWPAVVKLPLRLDYDRSPQAYENQRLQIQLELLMMSVVPLEIYWAFNERWNSKFYYKVAACWLFLLCHNTMHRSMNIRFMSCVVWRRVVGWVISDVSTMPRCLHLWLNETSGTARPTAQSNITYVYPLQLNDKPRWIRVYIVKKRWQTFNMTGV